MHTHDAVSFCASLPLKWCVRSTLRGHFEPAKCRVFTDKYRILQFFFTDTTYYAHTVRILCYVFLHHVAIYRTFIPHHIHQHYRGNRFSSFHTNCLRNCVLTYIITIQGCNAANITAEYNGKITTGGKLNLPKSKILYEHY